MKTIVMTLLMVYDHPRILLAMKKRDFGKGRWNGFGGKVLPGETIQEAARREALEEGGIVIDNMEKMGVIQFAFENKVQLKELETKQVEVHIFHVKSFSGSLVETEEMKPQWFHIDEVPYHEMWPDDKYWLPLFLAGKKFTGRFLFDHADNTKILDSELNIVAEL